MISVRSPSQKEALSTASTSYNRLDPVDFSTFKSYVKRYRRVSKISTTIDTTSSSSASGGETAKEEGVPSSSSSAVWKQLCLCDHLPQVITRPCMPRTSSSVAQVLREPNLLLDAGMDERSSDDEQQQQQNQMEKRRASLATSSSASSSSSSSFKATPYSSFTQGAKSFFTKSMGREIKVKKTEEAQRKEQGQQKKSYKESVTRLHLERLMVEIVFWEAVLSDLQCIHFWKRPELTAVSALAYYYFWYHNLLPAVFFS